MTVWLVVLIPIVALVVWGIIFDLRRRRRHAALTNHDIGSAAQKARANSDAGSAGWTDSGGGSSL
jgi:cytochrome c-type biogenesis protein CcmH/NrfF